MKPTLFILLMICSSALFAQEGESPQQRKIILNDLTFYTGSAMERNSYRSLSEFSALAPGSQLLQSDLTGYDGSTGIYYSSGSTKSIAGGIYFTGKEGKDLRHRFLKVGISLSTGSKLHGQLRKESREPYDTFTSQQTGQEIYVLLKTYEYISASHYADILALNVAFVFGTNKGKRFSGYAGLGISGGLAFNTRTDISYSKSTYTETDPWGISGQFYYSGNSSYREKESFYNRNIFTAATYLPLGVDFRLGNSPGLLRKIHLTYEIKPGIYFYEAGGVLTTTNIYLEHGIGLKYILKPV